MRRTLAQQSGGKFASTLPTTGASDAPVPTDEHAAKIHCGARCLSQPLQPRAPSHRPQHLQEPSHSRDDGVEDSCKLMFTRVDARGSNGISIFSLTMPTWVLTGESRDYKGGY